MTKKIFGLTGGIASGKSTLCSLFKEWGVPTLDADQIARKLREPGEVGDQFLLNTFQTNDPKKLRSLIFKDPKAREMIEAFFHPLIKKETENQLNALNAPLILYEASLLIETNRYLDFQGVVLVTKKSEDRLSSLMKRDQMTESDAKAILQSQTTDESKISKLKSPPYFPKPFFIVENTGSIEDLRQKSIALYSKLKNL